MKFRLFVLLISLTGFISKGYSQGGASSASPSLTINNNSSCSVNIILTGYDACTYTTHCELISYPITITSGGSVSYSDITYVNPIMGGAGWHTTTAIAVVACSTSGGGWDGLKFGSSPTCISSLGNNICISTTTSTFLSCACTNGWQASWTTDIVGNVTVNIQN